MACILLVNDEADLVDICEMMLEEAGYEVETLTDGRLALDVARRMGPDLIVLDWILRASRGEEVLRELRTDPVTAKIPVLMVSAIHDGEIIARTYGADGFLRKPFNGEALLNAVRQRLSRSESPTWGVRDRMR